MREHGEMDGSGWFTVQEPKGSKEHCLLGQNTTCTFLRVIPFINYQATKRHLNNSKMVKDDEK